MTKDFLTSYFDFKLAKPRAQNLFSLLLGSSLQALLEFLMIIVLTFVFSSVATLVTGGMFQFTLLKRVQMLELCLVHRGPTIKQEVDGMIKKPNFSDESAKCLSNLMGKEMVM